MLNCKQVTETTEQYLTKDLSFRQRLAVKLHLFICVHCRRYVAQYQATKTVVGRLLQQSAPKLDHRPAWQRIQQWRQQKENESKPES